MIFGCRNGSVLHRVAAKSTQRTRRVSGTAAPDTLSTVRMTIALIGYSLFNLVGYVGNLLFCLVLESVGLFAHAVFYHFGLLLNGMLDLLGILAHSMFQFGAFLLDRMFELIGVLADTVLHLVDLFAPVFGCFVIRFCVIFVFHNRKF